MAGRDWATKEIIFEIRIFAWRQDEVPRQIDAIAAETCPRAHVAMEAPDRALCSDDNASRISMPNDSPYLYFHSDRLFRGRIHACCATNKGDGSSIR